MSNWRVIVLRLCRLVSDNKQIYLNCDDRKDYGKVLIYRENFCFSYFYFLIGPLAVFRNILSDTFHMKNRLGLSVRPTS